jgi:GT2 family glycosyltransferase
MVNTQRKRVCISILNWNNAAETIDCIQSLGTFADIDAEVIVLDNGSSDDSVKVLSRTAGITLMTSDVNLGFAGGHNLVMRHALQHDFDYVWLLNNDACVDPGCLPRLLAAMEADPCIGAASPVIRDKAAPHRVQHALSLLNDTGTGVVEYPDLEQAAVMQQRHPDKIILWGTALLLKRSTIKQVGLLDDKLFAYSEDTDYSLRCIRHQLKNHVVLEAGIRHDAPPHPRKPHYYYYTQRNAILMWRKYVGLAQLARVIRWNAKLAHDQLQGLQGNPAAQTAIKLGIWDGLTGQGGAFRPQRALRPHQQWVIQTLLTLA